MKPVPWLIALFVCAGLTSNGIAPNTLVPISSIDAALLTYSDGIPTGGFLALRSFSPTTSPVLIDIDFTEGNFLLELPGLGIASGPISIVPVPAAAWFFGSAILALSGLRRNR